MGDKEEGITHCGPLGSWFSILSWLSLLALEKMERESIVEMRRCQNVCSVWVSV